MIDWILNIKPWYVVINSDDKLCQISTGRHCLKFCALELTMSTFVNLYYLCCVECASFIVPFIVNALWLHSSLKDNESYHFRKVNMQKYADR
jgi:hypothetical protein